MPLSTRDSSSAESRSASAASAARTASSKRCASTCLRLLQGALQRIVLEVRHRVLEHAGNFVVGQSV